MRLQRDAAVDVVGVLHHALGAEIDARAAWPAAPISRRFCSSVSSSTIACGHRLVIARRHEDPGRPSLTTSGIPPAVVGDDRLAARHRVEQRACRGPRSPSSSRRCRTPCGPTGRRDGSPARKTCFSRWWSLIWRSSGGRSSPSPGDDEARVRHRVTTIAAASIRCRCPLCGTSAATLPTIGAWWGSHSSAWRFAAGAASTCPRSIPSWIGDRARRRARRRRRASS